MSSKEQYIERGKKFQTSMSVPDGFEIINGKDGKIRGLSTGDGSFDYSRDGMVFMQGDKSQGNDRKGGSFKPSENYRDSQLSLSDHNLDDFMLNYKLYEEKSLFGD